MLIDIHTHTNRYSECSILSPLGLVERALQAGLDGIVITEHNRLWTEEEVRELSSHAPKSFVVLRGQEVDTRWGHVLVFGYDDKIPWNISIEKLKEIVHEQGGVIVVAHPFRFHSFLLEEMNEEDNEQFYRNFDAAEAYNGNCSHEENERAAEMALQYGLPALGGSDAHSLEMVGSYCTRFPGEIKNERELAEAIKSGKALPASCRAQLPLHQNSLRLDDLKKCRGVLFDLYGTLVDIAVEENTQAFSKFALWLAFSGISIGGDELMQEYLEGCAEAFEQGRQRSPHPEIDVPMVFKTILEKRCRKPISQEKLHTICLTFRALTIETLSVYPWVKALLQKLREQGYVTGLVSNAQRLFSEPELRALDIYRLFDSVVFSSDVGIQKPDAAIFQAALTQLHLSPEEALFIGNDLRCDIHGAKRLGMRTVLIKSNIPSHEFEAEPDFVVHEHEMSQVEHLLEKK